MEVVRIGADDFRDMIREFPDVADGLTKVARTRMQSDDQRHETPSPVALDDFLSQGLMEAQSLLVLDLEKCTRCDECVRACADAHEGVTRLVRDGLRFDKFLVATLCRSCRDPLLHGRLPGRLDPPQRDAARSSSRTGASAAACARASARTATSTCIRSKVDAEDPEHPGVTKAQSSSRRRPPATCAADYHEPACVYACPHDALKRIEPIKFFGIQT